MKMIAGAAVSMLLFVVCGCGGYKGMRSELAAYRPPVAFQPPAGEKNLSAPTPDAASRRDGGDQSADMRERWRKAARTVQTAHPFYRPDPDRFQRLSAAAKTRSGAAGVLKGGYTLKTLEMLTLIRNPGIQAARSRVQAEITAFSQVADLDAVLARYAAFTEGLMTGVGPMKDQGGIRMQFPFPGVTALKGEVVGASVKAAAASLAIARRDALTDVRKTYWNLLYVRKSRRITAETLVLFRRLESVANTRYHSGNTSFQDVIKVTIETRILEEDLVTLTERIRNVESKLLDVLDLPPETGMGPPTEQAPDKSLPSLARLYRLARERRQELVRLRAGVEKMALMLALGETMILPQYTLGFSYYDDAAVSQVGSAAATSPSVPQTTVAGNAGLGSGEAMILPQYSPRLSYDNAAGASEAGSMATKPTFATRTTASVGAGLPKSPWFGTNDAWLNGTRRSLDAAKADLEKAEAETDNRVRIAWFEMDKAIREASLYQHTVVDLSKSALDVSTRGYESGTVSFADVIGSYTNWLNVGLALSRKLSDIGVARAELEQTVGLSL